MDDPRLNHILAQRRWHARPERLVLVGLAPAERAAAALLLSESAAPFAQLIAEPGELTLLLPEDEWRARGAAFPRARLQGPLRAITFDLDLPDDLVGFLAAAARALAAAGVPILAVCGFSKDHLLVREAQLAVALAALEALAAA